MDAIKECKELCEDKEFLRVSSNVPQGRECVGNNGLTCNFIDIIDDETMVRIRWKYEISTKSNFSFNTI